MGEYAYQIIYTENFLRFHPSWVRSICEPIILLLSLLLCITDIFHSLKMIFLRFCLDVRVAA